MPLAFAGAVPQAQIPYTIVADMYCSKVVIEICPSYGWNRSQRLSLDGTDVSSPASEDGVEGKAAFLLVLEYYIACSSYVTGVIIFALMIWLEHSFD